MLRGIRKKVDIDLTAPAIKRFWNRVEKLPNGCWKWTGSDRGNGYGCIRVNGRMLSAHVVAFLWRYGEIPDGTVVAHKCDNRGCVNPDHLEAIPPGQNIRDGLDRLGRKYCRGEEVETSVLNDDIVREIRRLQSEGLGYQRIAKKLGHKISTVKGVCYGRTWRHVK